MKGNNSPPLRQSSYMANGEDTLPRIELAGELERNKIYI